VTQANSAAGIRGRFVVLGLLSAFGPISLDLYLPALPQLAAELEASTSAAQLTITFCLIGLAVGQVIAGPLSDRFGRKRPLMIGLVAYALSSLACAFAWSISMLLTSRRTRDWRALRASSSRVRWPATSTRVADWSCSSPGWCWSTGWRR
jgi:MFS family permease